MAIQKRNSKSPITQQWKPAHVRKLPSGQIQVKIPLGRAVKGIKVVASRTKRKVKRVVKRAVKGVRRNPLAGLNKYTMSSSMGGYLGSARTLAQARKFARSWADKNGYYVYIKGGTKVHKVKPSRTAKRNPVKVATRKNPMYVLTDGRGSRLGVAFSMADARKDAKGIADRTGRVVTIKGVLKGTTDKVRPIKRNPVKKAVRKNPGNQSPADAAWKLGHLYARTGGGQPTAHWRTITRRAGSIDARYKKDFLSGYRAEKAGAVKKARYKREFRDDYRAGKASRKNPGSEIGDGVWRLGRLYAQKGGKKPAGMWTKVAKANNLTSRYKKDFMNGYKAWKSFSR